MSWRRKIAQKFMVNLRFSWEPRIDVLELSVGETQQERLKDLPTRNFVVSLFFFKLRGGEDKEKPHFFS